MRGDSLDHRRPLERETPAEDTDALRNAHRLEHLGPEHAAVANLNRLVELLVVLEDFERGLGVGLRADESAGVSRRRLAAARTSTGDARCKPA